MKTKYKPQHGNRKKIRLNLLKNQIILSPNFSAKASINVIQHLECIFCKRDLPYELLSGLHRGIMPNSHQETELLRDVTRVLNRLM